MTREGKSEQRIITVLKKHGALSAMAIHKWTKLAHSDILKCLYVLGKAGVARQEDTGRTKKYVLAGDNTSLEESDEV